MSNLNESGLTQAEQDLIDVIATHAEGGSIALDVSTHEHEHPKLAEIRNANDINEIVNKTKLELRMPLLRNIRNQLIGSNIQI